MTLLLNCPDSHFKRDTCIRSWLVCLVLFGTAKTCDSVWHYFPAMAAFEILTEYFVFVKEINHDIESLYQRWIKHSIVKATDHSIIRKEALPIIHAIFRWMTSFVSLTTGGTALTTGGTTYYTTPLENLNYTISPILQKCGIMHVLF